MKLIQVFLLASAAVLETGCPGCRQVYVDDRPRHLVPQQDFRLVPPYKRPAPEQWRAYGPHEAAELPYLNPREA